MRAPAFILSLVALFLTPLLQRGLRIAPPLRVAREPGWCNHEYPRWGGHITIPESIATTSVLGASASIMGSELSVQLGSGPSVCPTPMP